MSEQLRGKLIVLGITGSIAAYKGAEVARRLMDLGAEVHATLTRAGERFITPLTLRTLTGQSVTVDMFDDPSEWQVEHVSLAKRAAAVVVAPATADAIAKLALGIADEFIYTVALATRAPIIIAPAMESNMLTHPATQANVKALRDRGVHFIEPEEGRLASAAVGVGRLAKPQDIAAAVAAILAPGDLGGARVIITAGPTQEPIDPVRYISNRSSGKMGYALAEAAARRSANVTLISGPTALPRPDGCEFVSVQTAQQMHDEVLRRFTRTCELVSLEFSSDFQERIRNTLDRRYDHRHRRGSGRIPHQRGGMQYAIGPEQGRATELEDDTPVRAAGCRSGGYVPREACVCFGRG